MSSQILEKLGREMFVENIKKSRTSTGKSILDFKFKKGRCRLLSSYEDLREDSKGIIYWMCRESRVQDNWALLYAQKLSLKYKVPLHVCFFLDNFIDLYPSTRQVKFLRKGLLYVERELEALNISFYLLKKSPLELAQMVKTNNIGCLVCEFFPLKVVSDWQNKLKDLLPENVAFVQVDAHNIVPCWIASDKLEKSNLAIRPKIVKQLPVYLTEFPEVCKQDYKEELEIDPEQLLLEDDELAVDFVEQIKWAEPGEEDAFEMLRTFLLERLKYYGVSSYDPSKKHQSDLSPWIHFGQISSQRIALEVSKMKNLWREQCERFLNEAIIRKEISDNYCLYNSNYNNFNGAEKWAQDTLNMHRKDKRDFIYTPEQFEKGLTHDPLWNSAQVQLLIEGKMQVYMRMYWCKKILEWTKSPEDAIEIALWLNNRYSIDGSDPNSFIGVMWSICGVHDQGFKERAIFGKIRFMVDYSLSKKYDMKSYCARYPPIAKASIVHEIPTKKRKDGQQDGNSESEQPSTTAPGKRPRRAINKSNKKKKV